MVSRQERLESGVRPVTEGSREGAPTAPAPEPPTSLTPQFWRDMLEGVDEAVLALDEKGVLRAANAVATRMLPQLRLGEVVLTPEPLAEALRAARATFDVDHDEHRLRGRRVSVGPLTVWYVRDVTEQVIRTDALLAERWRSAFLAEASRRLSASLHGDRTARTAVALAVPALGDCALIVLPGPRNSVRWFRYSGEDGEPASGRLPAEHLAAVPALGEALTGLESDDDPRLPDQLTETDWMLPDGFGRPGSAVLVPLPGHGRPVGALAVVRGTGRAGFEPVETHLIRQFAGRAGTALAVAALYAEQAHTADVLQSSLMPPTLPEVPGVQLGAVYRSARERLRIGGDFYDVYPARGATGPADSWRFVLGDVCGKGVEAAVQTGRVRQAMRALSLVEPEPLGLLRLLNESILSSGDGQFTTMVLGRIEPRPDGVALHVASGGHPAPIVLRADGTVETVQ
ncbi:GAF domain-containing SpoIIE family protein phosphatase, partial [Micromonospora echinofusca]